MTIRHLPFPPTPITETNYNTNNYKSGGVIFKRDDLFELAGGGSKARMLQYILFDATQKNVDVIVTAGGPLSNFNRACALQCASMGLKMHLICYTDKPTEFECSLNYFLVKLSNVQITICDKTKVAETIAVVMDNYKKLGLRARNIYGGGRSIEGIYSYYDAVKELYGQMDNPEKLSKVFVACGTGTTASGLSAGLQEFFPNTELHAISVARSADVELPIIHENLKMLNEYMGNVLFDGSNIRFHDEFILGNYGATNNELIELIKAVVSSTGILLDPVYSGKAFYGMTEILGKSNNEQVLFWHTGAVYTLMSERHLFDL